MATVLLARHGETIWNRTGRVQGWAPSTLTNRGRRQAQALAGHVAERYDVNQVYASDLRRAQQTAEYVHRALDVDPVFESAWRERDFGCMQGLQRDELYGEYPEFALSKSGYVAATRRPESGESLLDVHERVLQRWNDLCEDLGTGETVLVVAHGGPLHLLLGHLKDLTLVDSILEQKQDNCGLSELSLDSGGVEVVTENETSFLSGEAGDREAAERRTGQRPGS